MRENLSPFVPTSDKVRENVLEAGVVPSHTEVTVEERQESVEVRSTFSL